MIELIILLIVAIWTVGYIGEKQHDDIKEEIKKLNDNILEAIEKINAKQDELRKKINEL